ncbi:uncharacterized protein LOC103524992 isoform X2 [Diaphorina citri]|uniref:Uncharacterized protein LOC103524992 isoform X1 n=1 Tax=Diaphorina citri TaxID=121845 RepID=A0A1S4ET11_DIACI|nr:uncharacterized protein LOC103524992 isoform X1 [Diaphorina citri]XP_017305318.1 uncharacterized protein LOC103524992 isoform X2 [Diaphorina citri]
MVTTRPLFLLLLACYVVSSSGDSVDPTTKRRRGRPRKVTDQTTTEKVRDAPTTTTITDAPTTTTTRHVHPNGPTKTTFNEYETYFDSSGFWCPPRKQYPNVTTKKRRKFPTTQAPTRFHDPYTLDQYSPADTVTGRLEAMYYSLKQFYKDPKHMKEADHQVRDIIKKHDIKDGITDYTWVSLENKALGKLQNEKLREYEELKDVSDLI